MILMWIVGVIAVCGLIVISAASYMNKW